MVIKKTPKNLPKPSNVNMITKSKTFNNVPQHSSLWKGLGGLFCSLLFLFFSFSTSFAQSWPTVTNEAKAGARWWWLGSAVDKENLQWNLTEYAKHGIGAVEITPIYGVQGNDTNNIPYLSDKWMEMLRFTGEQCRQQGIELDMATGTGWPFGGPWVPLEESACRAIFVEKAIDSEGVWTTVNGHKGLQPDNTDTSVIDLSLSEKDAKNAVLDNLLSLTLAVTSIALPLA